MNSAVTDEKLSERISASATDGGSNIGSFVGFEASGHDGYGLREKPMKTLKLSDSYNDKGMLRQEAPTCRACGKGFHSWKALCGHMRCHSKRVRISCRLNDDSLTNGKNEDPSLPPKKSRRMRDCKIAATSSSSVSEIDQEQIEGALCLIMFSRDVGRWGGFNSVETASSDNDPVISEAQTRSSGLGNFNPGKRDENFDFACDRDYENLKNLKMKKPRVQNLADAASDFGFLRVGLESKVSIDGILSDDQLKKSNLENVGLGKDFFRNNQSNRKKSKLDYSEDELGKGSIEEAGMNRADSVLRKYNGSGKKSRSNGYNEICRDNLKRRKFECTTCNKIFNSHQALGGHRASHKKIKARSSYSIKSSKNSIEIDVSDDPTTDCKLNKSTSNDTLIEEEKDGDIDDVSGMSYESKKCKGHECPICFKVFGSGQALGSHKRIHFARGSECRDNQTIQK
ncbi:hypothetical protein NE237_001882 [Protea cynaroides]|uniref:C2H2-type domain-containing protein n=1 Tax=Protea cynaroides TaxID=273540 RepID=A0A9Q0KV01_9MAGN|nr:hypothetical protein NE237_001882 [Protea cynaroides]